MGYAGATEAKAGGSSGNQTTEAKGYAWPAWHAQLVAYRNPERWRSLWQLTSTLVSYVSLWFVMVWMLEHGYPYALTLVVAVCASFFLVRVFVLFHDGVHGSLFESRAANTCVGYLLGSLVFTPFEDWRYSHLRHHASYANLDTRGFGDIWTLTRAEYEASSARQRLCYRLYRNPVVMLGLGAIFTFLLRFRLPTRRTTRKERMSVLLTDLLIIGMMLVAVRFVGWRAYLIIQLLVMWLAGAAGIWLFYVQHQFDGVYWARRREWDPLRAAMQGSSFYNLPSVLRWFSCSIGYHHVHHLNARIPNYRLKECYDAIPALQVTPAMTFGKSLSTVRLKVWDEECGKLVGFPPGRE